MSSNYVIGQNGSFISEDELYHHGIKGMKWGIRRYQNPNRSLTNTGRKQAIKEKDRNYHSKAKKAMKIGAAIAGTALAVYGGYKLSRYVKSKGNSSKLARKILEESLPVATMKTSGGDIRNAVKTAVIPRAEVNHVPISRINAYRSNDFESLKKANAGLLNKTLDDLLTGL